MSAGTRTRGQQYGLKAGRAASIDQRRASECPVFRTAGLMGTSELVSSLKAAADRAGEEVWPMPLPEELRPSLDSQIADIANLGAGHGGMMTAAVFLQEFVGSRQGWPVDSVGAFRHCRALLQQRQRLWIHAKPGNWLHGPNLCRVCGRRSGAKAALFEQSRGHFRIKKGPTSRTQGEQSRRGLMCRPGLPRLRSLTGCNPGL